MELDEEHVAAPSSSTKPIDIPTPRAVGVISPPRAAASSFGEDDYTEMDMEIDDEYVNLFNQIAPVYGSPTSDPASALSSSSSSGSSSFSFEESEMEMDEDEDEDDDSSEYEWNHNASQPHSAANNASSAPASPKTAPTPPSLTIGSSGTHHIAEDRERLTLLLKELKKAKTLIHSCNMGSKEFETLEFYGDSELEYRVSHLLMNSQPHAPGPVLAAMNSSAVKNATLALVYDLLQAGHLPQGLGGEIAKPGKLPKILKQKGDVIEAITGELRRRGTPECLQALKDLVQFIHDVYVRFVMTNNKKRRHGPSKTVVPQQRSNDIKRRKIAEGQHVATGQLQAETGPEQEPESELPRKNRTKNQMKKDKKKRRLMRKQLRLSSAQNAEEEPTTTTPTTTTEPASSSPPAPAEQSVGGWMLDMINDCDDLIASGTFAESAGGSETMMVKLGWRYTSTSSAASHNRAPDSSVGSQGNKPVSHISNVVAAGDGARTSQSALASGPVPVVPAQAALMNPLQSEPAPAPAATPASTVNQPYKC